MSESASKTILVVGGATVLALLLLLRRPGYLTSPEILGAVVGAEIVFAAMTKFRQAFFPILITIFLWAGIDVPFRSMMLQGRWIALALGGVAGLAVYLKDRTHFFNTFHLVALFCVLSAIVSSSVSDYTGEALLKALSLTLLFLYATAGARAAVSVFQPERFFRKLVLGCEVLTYAVAVSYLVMRNEFFGNPNSLGAVMGVAVVPTLLWGFLVAETRIRKQRYGIVLVVALLLLMSSFSRAGIGAVALSSSLICISLRQYRLLVKGLAATALIATLVVLFVPRPTEAPDLNADQPVASIYLYKGKQDAGLWGSRKGVWSQTWSVIKDRPWFGSGFGTSVITKDMTVMAYAKTHIDSWITREHGNSYLEIAEWSGLLGVIPFYFLVVLCALNVKNVFSWLRRTGDVFSPAVPAAAIVAAGLFHAMFEDWMFAVGYYLCVFFWAMAFILVDVLPRATVIYMPETPAATADQRFPLAASGRSCISF